MVKVAPPGLAPVRNRDVLRQARLLRALRGTARRRAGCAVGRRRRAAGDPAAVRDVVRRRHVAGAPLRSRRPGARSRRCRADARRGSDPRRAPRGRSGCDRARRRAGGGARRGDRPLVPGVGDRRPGPRAGVGGRGRIAARQRTAAGAAPRSCTATSDSATCSRTGRPSPRSSTGRSGASPIHGSTWAGSSRTRIRRRTSDRPGTQVDCRRPPSCSRSTPRRSDTRSPTSPGSGRWRASSRPPRGR